MIEQHVSRWNVYEMFPISFLANQ